MGDLCKKCGASVFDGDKFCSNCGARFGDEPAETTARGPVAVEKVGSATVSADDRIECEVCGAHYHGLPGNKNDCPLCNAPGGKGLAATVGTSLAGNPLAPQVEALGKTVAQLSVRVAELEAGQKAHAEILKEGS